MIVENRKKTGMSDYKPRSFFRVKQEHKKMYFKVIACNVLTREIGWCAARCLHTLDIVFLPKDEHNAPSRLRESLQMEIERVPAGGTGYDAILLAYGLCGNATVGLTARNCPLVIPRAHDCTTLFLGSREAFGEHFKDNPSRPWTSIGYAERGDTLISDGNARAFGTGNMSFAELAEMYGEDNARYLTAAMGVGLESEELPFLDVPETCIRELAERLKTRISEAGKTAVPLPGSIRLIEGLLSGRWPENDYLVVKPGERIEGVYDYEQIIKSEKGNGF